MSEQLSTPRRSLAFAAAFLFVAMLAFSASYYLFDGAELGGRWLQRLTSAVWPASPQQVQPVSPVTGETPAPDALQLPEGMSEEFALRLWQEQIDSQPMIDKLVDGSIRSLRIDRVEKGQQVALLHSTVRFEDGTSVPGVIGLRRFGEHWYVAYATSLRRDAGDAAKAVIANEDAAGATPLPDISTVNVDLLNTIMREQRNSQLVIGEYLAGVVKEVFVEKAVRGPNTVTLDIEMDETHGDAYAKIVVINSESDGRNRWFMARFEKTGDENAMAQ